MHYGAPYLLMCRGDLHVKARRRARLGLRVRCLADAIAPAQFLAPSSNCAGYALHLLTNVRFGMTPTLGSTLDGTSGCGMKRVPGADGPWQFIEIFLSSDD